MPRMTIGVLLLLCFLPPVTSSRQQGPRILLVYDMEGVTGAARPEDVNFGSSGYATARESLVEDVNAAIRGLLKAGASEVVLTDAHGSGNSEPDYPLERLPKGARHDVRTRPYDPYIESMGRGFAAVAAIGMHAGAGKRGFLAHTFTGHTRWVMNGHDMNESMIIAASAARFDMPLVLVTGDDHLREEIRTFSPATHYVAVKRAISSDEAEPRERTAVSADIEEAAARAFSDLDRILPWHPAARGAPVANEFGYIMPEQASMAIRYPGAESVNNKTVRLRTACFLDAYLAFRALAGFTALVPSALALQNLGELEGGAEILREVQRRATQPGRSFAPTAPEVSLTFGPGRHGIR